MFFNSSGFSVFATDWTRQKKYFQVTHEWQGSNMSQLTFISVITYTYKEAVGKSF